MRKILPTRSFLSGLRTAALGLGLLAGARAAHGQASSIYALGTFTAEFSFRGQTAARGTQVLIRLDANSPAISSPSDALAVFEVTAGQQLVGLDTRPNSGQLYALGYDNTAGVSPNAQVYLLNLGDKAVVAQPIGNPITLDLGLSNRTDLDTYNLIVGVGFDFNPRTDLLRVTGSNGANYRLSPSTGQLVATDAKLTYAATGNTVTVPPPNPPFISTVAHDNSAIGLRGTTLYDVDETPNNGVLSTQSLMPATSGTLTTLAKIMLITSGRYGIGNADLDLDIFTDAGYQPVRNNAYLLELTDRFSSKPGTANLYNFDLQTGDAVRIDNIISGTSAPLRFTNIAAAPANPPAVWTGAVSTNWDTPGNWNTNEVPGDATNVFIPGPGPTVPHQPTVNNSQQAHTVILDASPKGPAVLTVAGTLNLTGDLLNSGGSVTGQGTVNLVGQASQDISGPGSSQFGNLRVGTAGATLSGPATVAHALTLTGSLTVAASQPLTLLSNADGTAYVVNSGGVVTGTVTVQRYIGAGNAGLGYRHYSAPVTNTTVGDLATSTFAPVFNAAYNTSPTPGTTTPFPTVYGYNQAQYENSPATAITLDFDKGFYSPAGPGAAWPSGTGFTVNLGGSELVDFVGTLANGDISTPGQGRSAKTNAGWQLLGNPYPSPLDWNQVVKSGLVNVAPTLYVYKSSGQYAGNYASYLNGQATNGGTNVVPVAQGFFVCTAAEGIMGNINFTNDQRLTTGAQASFQRTAADLRPQLLLELSNEKLASQTAIYFERGATAGFDTDFDAPALPLSNGLLLASETGADVLAINGQPALSSAAVTVPLRLAVAAAGPYALRAADLANLPAGYHAYLRDATRNTYTDLATTPILTLNLASGAAPGRFAVLFTSAAPLATAPAALVALATVFPSPAQGTATLVLPRALRGNAESTVQLLNTLGQIVLTRTLSPNGADSIELPLTGLAAGVYTVRATTAAGLVAKRLVVQE